MKKITTLLLTVLFSMTVWAEIPDGFYNNAIGKQDEDLMTSLEGIIYTHTLLGYNYLWDCYPSTDAGSDGYYIDMYSTCKYDHSSPHPGTASYVGQGLNREHSFPKSWFGGEVDPMYTDLMMIIPADAYVNQRRSNHPYGVCANGITYTNEDLGVSMKGKLGTSTYNGYTSTVFEPDDEYKGDFARIYFYMVTCYKSVVGTWPGSGQLDYTSNQYKAFSNWSMQMLMEWHRADPVSQKEISRNEAVYVEQGNRNPFVDCPELAEHIWGTKQNTPWTGEGLPQYIEKLQPVMLDVDTTTVTGTSFRADWTRGGDVSSYTLQVNRLAEGADNPVLLLTEGFGNVVAYSDGYNDIGESLDEYTDNPGWTGFKVYTAAGHSLKFGTAELAGYLISPELELTSTVSVKFTGRKWKNDKSTVIVSCGDISQTVTLTDTDADYVVVLTGCDVSNIKLSGTGAKDRFYISRVEIYNGDLNTLKAQQRDIVEEGDSTMRTVSGITDTCYTVKALAAGTFEYLVKAIYLDGTESAWSNIKHVVLTGAGIGDVNMDGITDIEDVTLLIARVLGTNEVPVDEAVADINGDQVIDIEDVTTLINLILGI
jgi:endonuclease I